MRRIGMLAAGFSAGAAIVGLVATSAFAGGVTSYATYRAPAAAPAVTHQAVRSAVIAKTAPAVKPSAALVIPAASPPATRPVQATSVPAVVVATAPAPTKAAAAATVRPVTLPAATVASASPPAAVVAPAALPAFSDPMVTVYWPAAPGGAYCTNTDRDTAVAYTGPAGELPGSSVVSICPVGVPRLIECSTTPSSNSVQVAAFTNPQSGAVSSQISAADVGDKLVGPGVPAGDKVATVHPSSTGLAGLTLTVSAAALGTGSGGGCELVR
jgi:hypothetical protein